MCIATKKEEMQPCIATILKNAGVALLWPVKCNVTMQKIAKKCNVALHGQKKCDFALRPRAELTPPIKYLCGEEYLIVVRFVDI